MSGMTENCWCAMRRQSHQALLKRALAVQMSECMAKPAKHFVEIQVSGEDWSNANEILYIRSIIESLVLTF